MPPFCPQCGVDNPATARYCDQCGAALIPVPAASTAAPTAPTAPVSQPATTPAAPAAPALSAGPTTCPQCGASAFAGEAFCDNCGAPLSAPVRPVSSASIPATPGVPAQPTYPTPQPAAINVPPVIMPAPEPLTPPATPMAPSLPVSPVVPPAQPTATQARLVVISSGAALPLPPSMQVVIGRADPVSGFVPDIDLTPHGALDTGVGRRHARLNRNGGQVLLEDLDSTNGTLLNGRKLAPRQPQPLTNGDQIQFGKLALQFLV